MAVTAVLFDEGRGRQVDEWRSLASHLDDDHVLWLDVVEPTRQDDQTIAEAFGITAPELSDRNDDRPSLRIAESHSRVVALAAPRAEDEDPQLLVCLVGRSWVVTAHAEPVEAMRRFHELVEGVGEIGRLDAPSFLADALEWVVATYARAFSDIEEKLERADEEILTRPHRAIDPEVRRLVGVRRDVGRLRRLLVPHRDVFAALAHPEFDVISTPRSAELFSALCDRVDDAIEDARDAREALVGSFDMLVLRTEHRTNEIVKVLTFVSILLLPGALIAAVAGMNVNLTLMDFVTSGVFWLTIAVIAVIAAAALLLARRRRWL